MRRAWIFGLAMSVSMVMAGAARPARGQEPVLVRDIATEPAFSPGSGASPPVRFRGENYFGADDGLLGYELWATNGTPRGTRLVADLCPGRCSGAPWVLTPSGDLLFFIAGNTTSGGDSFWVWRSDGTAEGTFPLVNLEIRGFGSAFPVTFFAPFRGGVVFNVYERARRGWGLWGTDGTRAGTRRIAPLPGRFNPDDSPLNFDWPRVQDDPGTHYFAWLGKLWATDGTAAGTGPVATPVRPCGGWARLGGLVVYAGEDEALDCEPWVSDGTGRGTRRLRDIWHGSPSYPAGFATAGGWVYFTAFDGLGHGQLWQTHGTLRGTRIVRALGTRGLGKVEILGTVGSRIYFAADDGEHGTELWRSEGTPESTALVADLSPGAAGTGFIQDGARRLGDQLLFLAAPSGASTYGIFRTRGSADSTLHLADYGVVGGPALSVAGGRLYFSGFFAELGQELGVTDGTVEGTHVLDLARPVTSSDPSQLIAGSGGLIFLATGNESDTDLWRSGGHQWDTEPLADLLPGSSGGIRLVPGSGGAFYYTFGEARFGWTDGRTIGDLFPPGTFFYPEASVELGDRTLLFAARALSETVWQPWIWSSDGTPEGTVPVAAAAGHTGEAYSFRSLATLVPGGGEARFLVRQESSTPPYVAVTTLWTTDGTAAGTHELVQVPVGRYQALNELVAAGPYVFASIQSDYRASLWASDGTAEGTREVYAVTRPFYLSYLSELTAAGEQAFFLGDDFERGRELWVSDGTAEGTRQVADLAPGAASSAPSDVVALGSRVLFSADDGTHGRELWVSDGTAEGTRLLEIHSGPRGSYPQAFRVIGDQAVFAADDGVHGLEPWVTDGTPEGTRLVADVMAGPPSSSPRELTVQGDELFFNAGRPREGYELWKLPLAALEP